MEDEFIEDDFLEEEESSTNNRPFLIAVGALVTIFILATACTLAFLLAGNESASNGAEVAAIETQNAITIVTNTAVAQFISQTETAQAMPTDTPEPPPTNTNTPVPPTDTPEPTETPVIDEVVDEGEGEIGGGEPVTGTIIIGEDGGDGSGSVVGGDAVTPIAGTDAQEGTLPQTGLETWVIALIGLLLVGVLIAANRLRTN